MKERIINLPQAKAGKPLRSINYLADCGVSYTTTEHLIEENLLYEDANSNMIFKNYNATCAEIRTTRPTAKSHPITTRVNAEKFWYFGKHGNLVYICTNAVDAVALYELTRTPAIYASCSGSNNYKIIQRIIDSGREVVLALDNSPTSDKARERFPENEKLKHIKPKNKSWVDDLINKKGL